MTATTTQGKTDADDNDDDSDSAEFGPDIDEDALINEKPNLKGNLFQSIDHFLAKICPQIDI